MKSFTKSDKIEIIGKYALAYGGRGVKLMEKIELSAVKKLVLYVYGHDTDPSPLCKLLEEKYTVIAVDEQNRDFSQFSSGAGSFVAAIINTTSAAADDYRLFDWIKRDSIIEAVPMLIYCKDESELPVASECLKRGAVDVIMPPLYKELIFRRIDNAARLKDSASFYEIENMLKELPSNIYLKDNAGRYIFATHYWHHLDHSDDKNWTIRGKTDVEIRKDKKNAIKAMENDLEIIRTGKGARYVIEEKADGVSDYLEVIKRPVRDENGNIKGIIALINNITEQHLLRLSLEAKALRDELTDTFNRHYFDKYITCINEAPKPVSFISADLNDLKFINDNYGHFVGDEYIRMSTMLFKTTLPEGALIFRMGGDEFTMILPGADLETARGYISKLLTEQQRFRIMDKELSIAYGASCIERDSGFSVRDYLAAADMEMYKAKKAMKQARAGDK